MPVRNREIYQRFVNGESKDNRDKHDLFVICVYKSGLSGRFAFRSTIYKRVIWFLFILTNCKINIKSCRSN